MKYSKKLVQEIHDELIKTPNIRYVCNKFGIHFSTFYRWQCKHDTFSKMITSALEMGRDMMNDSAEAVIINGIQNNDRMSSQYWLAHNSPRYASNDKARYMANRNEHLIKFFEEKPKDDSTTAFESLFDMYYTMEKVHGDTEAKRQISKFVKMLAHDDEDLEEIFYVSYTEWKNNKDNLDKRGQELREQLDRNKEDK